MWMARDGWTREFSTAKPTRRRAERPVVKYTPFAERAISLEPPAYFKTDEPEADRMTYGELKRLHRPAAGQRLPRRALHGAAAAEGRLSVRHADHDAARGAVRGDDRPAAARSTASASASCWRSSTGPTLSIFGALGAGGWISPMLARLGAEYPVRRGRALPAADRPDVRRRLRPFLLLERGLPDPDPPRVAQSSCSSRRRRTGWLRMPARGGVTVCVSPTGVRSSKDDRVLLRRRVDVDRPLPAIARRLALIVARAQLHRDPHRMLGADRERQRDRRRRRRAACRTPAPRPARPSAPPASP